MSLNDLFSAIRAITTIQDLCLQSRLNEKDAVLFRRIAADLQPHLVAMQTNQAMWADPDLLNTLGLVHESLQHLNRIAEQNLKRNKLFRIALASEDRQRLQARADNFKTAVASFTARTSAATLDMMHNVHGLQHEHSAKLEQLTDMLQQKLSLQNQPQQQHQHPQTPAQQMWPSPPTPAQKAQQPHLQHYYHPDHHGDQQEQPHWGWLQPRQQQQQHHHHQPPQPQQQQQQQQACGGGSGFWGRLLSGRMRSAASSGSSSSTSYAGSIAACIVRLEEELSVNPSDNEALSFLLNLLHAHTAPQAYQQQQQQQPCTVSQMRQLSVQAMDALLHLTPRPQGCQSFFTRSSLDHMCTEAGFSLTLHLLQHQHTVAVLAAALWAPWPEVVRSAAELLEILVSSSAAVAAAGPKYAQYKNAAAEHAQFCQRVCDTSSVHWAGRGIWAGLAAALCSVNINTAGAAAEAVAVIAESSSMVGMCSSAAALQVVPLLLVLLAKHQQHSGAAGAAAAALTAMAATCSSGHLQLLRPEVHENVMMRLQQCAGAQQLQELRTGRDALAADRAALLEACCPAVQ